MLLSASAMLELPAIATALASGLLVFVWRDRQQIKWLILSGVVMGVALGIKLTAVLVAPAILTEILLRNWAGVNRTGVRAALVDLTRWGMSALAALLINNFLWGRGSYHHPFVPISPVNMFLGWVCRPISVLVLRFFLTIQSAWLQPSWRWCWLFGKSGFTPLPFQFVCWLLPSWCIPSTHRGGIIITCISPCHSPDWGESA